MTPVARAAITRAAVAMLAILVRAGLSLIGITDLIAKGYGTMAWAFLLASASVPLIVRPETGFLVRRIIDDALFFWLAEVESGAAS